MLSPIPLPLDMDRVFDDALHPFDDSGFGAASVRSRLDATFIKAATNSRKLAISQSDGGIPAMLDILSRADLAYADLPSAHLVWQNKFGVTYSRYPGVNANETFGGKTVMQLFEQIQVAALSASESKLAECISLLRVLSGTDMEIWFEEQGARLPANRQEFDEVLRRQRFVKHNLDNYEIPRLEKRIMKINAALVEIRGCSSDGLVGLGLTFDDHGSPSTSAASSELLLTPPSSPIEGWYNGKTNDRIGGVNMAPPNLHKIEAAIPEVRPLREVPGISCNRREGRRVGKVVPKFGVIGEERKAKWGVIGGERARRL